MYQLDYLNYIFDRDKFFSVKQWLKLYDWVIDKEHDFPFFTIKYSHPSRRIPINLISNEDRILPNIDESTGFGFCNNTVKTYRYNLLNFLPKQILLLCSNYAYIFLFLMALLQLIPGVATSGWAPIILPLLAWFSIEMILELIADISRRNRDRKENNSSKKVLTFNKEVCQVSVIKQKDIKVGDILELDSDELVPSDMVILKCHSMDDRVYVETSSLDGETNLKIRSSIPGLNLTSDERFYDFLRNDRGMVIVTHPNPSLIDFRGKLILENSSHEIIDENVVYRSCAIRNTEKVWGLVIYTGHETKERLNLSRKSSSKKSSLSNALNRIILNLIAIVFSLAILYSSIYYFKFYPEEEDTWYLGDVKTSLIAVFLIQLFFYQSIVPLALFTVLRINKYIQKFFIENDLGMYDENLNRAANVDSVDLVDELGRIEYIFSDKTGTLTENLLNISRISFSGIIFNHYSSKQNMEFRSFKDPLSTTYLVDYCIKNQDNELSIRFNIFLEMLALCQTCLPVQNSSNDYTFQGASQDEVAILEAAQQMGYIFRKKQGDTVILKLCKSLEENLYVTKSFKILKMFEFTSERKRMSIIYETEDKEIFIVCKGADESVLPKLKYERLVVSAITKVSAQVQIRNSIEIEDIIKLLPRMSFNEARNNSMEKIRTPIDNGTFDFDELSNKLPSEELFFKNTFEHTNRFSEEGLRVLIYAKKYIPRKEYETFNKLSEASKKGIKEDDLINYCESQLDLVGAVGIEDKLQSKVCETLFSLQRAGIKIWMVTGDKQGTASNIAKSCSLMTEISETIHLQGSIDDMVNEVDEFSELYESTKVIHLVVLVSGSTISSLTGTTASHSGFPRVIQFLLKADTVICYRASPSQKANLVKLVRAHTRAVTLAIGDGVNDVSMIKEANVGVGIYGKEGGQAAMHADFSFTRFKYLNRLILIHGFWNYFRQVRYVSLTIYKEALLYFGHAIYSIFCHFTGTNVYEPWTFMQYNTVFTSIPLIVFGAFHKERDETTLLESPENYIKSSKVKIYPTSQAYSELLIGLSQAVIIHLLTVYVYGFTVGSVSDIYSLGVLLFFSTVITLSIRLFFITLRPLAPINIIGAIFVIVCLLLWHYVFSLVYSVRNIYIVKDTFIQNLAPNLLFWLTCIISVAISTLWYIIYMGFFQYSSRWMKY